METEDLKEQYKLQFSTLNDNYDSTKTENISLVKLNYSLQFSNKKLEEEKKYYKDLSTKIENEMKSHVQSNNSLNKENSAIKQTISEKQIIIAKNDEIIKDLEKRLERLGQEKKKLENELDQLKLDYNNTYTQKYDINIKLENLIRQKGIYI